MDQIPNQIPSIYIQIAESLLMINIYGQGEQSMLIVINGQIRLDLVRDFHFLKTIQ